MKDGSKTRITVFHCINVFAEGELQPIADDADVDVTFVKMACSSMVKDVFILKAFETGADAVGVLVCPEGACRYVEGNLRAKKRVKWVQDLLNEIGLGGDRLALFNWPANQADAFSTIIAKLKDQVVPLGPNPAA
jgi:coenzyme F420-reducing hydrogenase delta subunit